MSEAATALAECIKAMISGLGTVLEGLKAIIGQVGPAWTNIKAMTSIVLTKLLAICMTIVYAINGYTGPATDDIIKAKDEENVRMTFAAWADPQVSNYIFEREPYFRAAGDDLKNAEGKVDALLIAGDIAENGLQCEYDLVYDDIFDSGVDNYIMATGNHDVRLRKYSETVERFTGFMNRLNENAGNTVSVDALHYTYDVNGYTFIVMGTDRTEFEEAYFNDEQLNWLDQTLSEVTATGKPAFVVIHQTLKNMHGLPDTWNSPFDWAGSVGVNSDQLYEIMNRYDNVIMISGHLHTGFGQYTYEMAGKVHSVNLPSIAIDNMDGACNDNGIGYMVEVYDHEVLFRARNFSQGKYLPDYDIAIELV